MEIPTKDHSRPECVAAKEAEIESLKGFGTFEDVKDVGQECINSRWILTEKQAHDGQESGREGLSTSMEELARVDMSRPPETIVEKQP